jgi:hypothetical protein
MKSITFGSPMILAILDGRKEETRRPKKGDKPRYQVGDRVCVKEAWRTLKKFDHLRPSHLNLYEPIRYGADSEARPPGMVAESEWGRYRHARFMPEWASRLTIEITSVQAERVQEITEEGAMAEGVASVYDLALHPDGTAIGLAAGGAFAALWESIYGPGAWERNDEVWVYGFKVVK